ncbi:MAG: DUF6285 domain-containing protein [Proteobacteria bacterium]|nr:DUF6285 domain-containing protein [Pseudomonadota bacterium]
MNDRPSAEELLQAVARFLSEDAVAQLEGPARYHARVAANVVGIVARELASEDRHLAGEWERLSGLLDDDAPAPGDRAALRDAITDRTHKLVERIRAGDADAGPFRDALVAHLRRAVADKLEVARPPKRS